MTQSSEALDAEALAVIAEGGEAERGQAVADLSLDDGARLPPEGDAGVVVDHLPEEPELVDLEPDIIDPPHQGAAPFFGRGAAESAA